MPEQFESAGLPADTVQRVPAAGVHCSSLLCDYRSNAILEKVAETELHEEVRDWVASLDETEWARVAVVIDRLVDLGSSARMPLSRSLGEGLFEMRFALGPTARRITYRFTKDGRIILLTTFRKQRNNERGRDHPSSQSRRGIC